MSASPDQQADIAAILAGVPVAIVVIGAIAIHTSGGWETIAFYLMRMFGVGLTALVAIVLAVVAIARGTKKKEKAYLAIFVSFIAFVASIILVTEK